jgi:hypothetical protein
MGLSSPIHFTFIFNHMMACAGLLVSPFRRPNRFPRNLRRCLGLLILLLSSAGVLLGLDPGKHIDQYGHDSWTSQQGLPGEAVYQILQTHDGYLWMRTSEAWFGSTEFALSPWIP